MDRLGSKADSASDLTLPFNTSLRFAARGGCGRFLSGAFKRFLFSDRSPHQNADSL
jgi:hypothetical protein